VTGLASEINIVRHLPLPDVALLVADGADPVDVELCRLAASTVGVAVRACGPGDIGTDASARVRALGDVTEEVLRGLHRRGVVVDARRPVADGDVELRRWVREQAVSITAHRYGRPLDRAAWMPPDC